MTIRWDFDREKLTAREAQIVNGMLDLAVVIGGVGIVAGVGGRLERHAEEGLAEMIRRRISWQIPGLNFQWTWEPPGDPTLPQQDRT